MDPETPLAQPAPSPATHPIDDGFIIVALSPPDDLEAVRRDWPANQYDLREARSPSGRADALYARARSVPA